MKAPIVYRRDTASAAAIAAHLGECDGQFVPALSSRVDIAAYAKKIEGRALRIEAWSGRKLVGLVAVYCNDRAKRIAYVTSVSVLEGWTRKGVATALLKRCAKYAASAGMKRLDLEVAAANGAAIGFYEKAGFKGSTGGGESVTMSLKLKGGKRK